MMKSQIGKALITTVLFLGVAPLAFANEEVAVAAPVVADASAVTSADPTKAEANVAKKKAKKHKKKRAKKAKSTTNSSNGSTSSNTNGSSDPAPQQIVDTDEPFTDTTSD